jgi:hypothetical protein
MILEKKQIPVKESHASVHCPICTHAVPATVLVKGRSVFVKPGQKCARCAASLDAGRLMWLDRAA